MGARLSQPRGPAGIAESSVPAKPAAPPTPKNPFPRRLNSRSIAVPATAFTMALLLFIYARTSIDAAKANAQRHRDADSGGEGLSLLNEHRRRHGLREKVNEEGTLRQLGRQLIGGGAKNEDGSGSKRGDTEMLQSEEEERTRLLKANMDRRRVGKG